MHDDFIECIRIAWNAEGSRSNDRFKCKKAYNGSSKLDAIRYKLKLESEPYTE